MKLIKVKSKKRKTKHKKRKTKQQWRDVEGLLGRLPRKNTIRTWDLILRINKRDHTFQFSRGPTLDDFLAVCMMLPYTSAWDEFVIPALIKCKWPKIPACYKRAEETINNVGPDNLTVRVTIQFGQVWSSVSY